MIQYNYYSYKGSGFFFFPLPVGRMLLRVAHKTEGIVFSELDAIMDMWLHTILNDPKVRGSEYMPVVYYSNMRGVPLLSYTYLAKRWGWSKSRIGITKAADLVDSDEGKMDISIETRVPPAHTIGKPRKALRMKECQMTTLLYLRLLGNKC